MDALSDEVITMGKNPNVIFRELSIKAKQKQKAIDSHANVIPTSIHLANIQDRCIYVPYETVIKTFLIEGYSAPKAEKHINQWLDYDMIGLRYIDGSKFIGFSDLGVI